MSTNRTAEQEAQRILQLQSMNIQRDPAKFAAMARQQSATYGGLAMRAFSEQSFVENERLSIAWALVAESVTRIQERNPDEETS